VGLSGLLLGCGAGTVTGTSPSGLTGTGCTATGVTSGVITGFAGAAWWATSGLREVFCARASRISSIVCTDCFVAIRLGTARCKTPLGLACLRKLGAGRANPVRTSVSELWVARGLVWLAGLCKFVSLCLRYASLGLRISEDGVMCGMCALA